MSKEIVRYVITREQCELRAVSELYTTEDFELDYVSRTTIYPQVYEVFMDEAEAEKAFAKLEPNSPYRQKANVGEVIFYEVHELVRQSYDIEDDDVADDESFDVCGWEIDQIESLDMKFSPDEEVKGGSDE